MAADLLAQESGLQVRCPNAVGLAYSIVNLTKNGGLGDFTAVNQPITGGLTEQITLVRHANGKNVWIIVHPYGTAQYKAILVTDSGFQAPVITNIGCTGSISVTTTNQSSIRHHQVQLQERHQTFVI